MSALSVCGVPILIPSFFMFKLKYMEMMPLTVYHNQEVKTNINGKNKEMILKNQFRKDSKITVTKFKSTADRV